MTKWEHQIWAHLFVKWMTFNPSFRYKLVRISEIFCLTTANLVLCYDNSLQQGIDNSCTENTSFVKEIMHLMLVAFIQILETTNDSFKYF